MQRECSMNRMRKNFAKAAVGAVLAVGLGEAHPAQAGLALTAAGIADQFTLSNFLSGGSGYSFLGAANLPDGTLAVGGFSPGTIYKFADSDGQTKANALSSVAFAGEIDLATAGGQAYAASRNTGFYQVSNNLTLTQITPGPAATAFEGIAGNPVGGHLIIRSSGGLIELNPLTGINRLIAIPPAGADGVSVSADGKTVYVAIFGGSEVQGYDIATGALVFDSKNLPGGPDGTAVIIGGDFDGSIVVNNNDGSVGLIDVIDRTETIIATGGTRGDFASPDLNNGSLLLFEDDSAWRLGIKGGGIGGGGTPVPEPASAMLFGIGVLAIRFARRKAR